MEDSIEPTGVRNRCHENDTNIVQTNEAKSLVVMITKQEVEQSTLNWLILRLKAKRQYGAELKVSSICDKETGETILHISAESRRLVEAAELMEMKKSAKDGSVREVSLGKLSDFHNSDDLDSFLTEAEKQRIILHEIEQLRVCEDEKIIPGLQMESFDGETIFTRLCNDGIIRNVYPLHDKKVLTTFNNTWVRLPLAPQPIASIRTYFGESIAMYFAFLGNYTMALIPPALIGFFSAVLVGYENTKLMIFFSVFNLVWATLFLEQWKRHCSTLAYSWGTLNTERFEEPRAAFEGQIGFNPITGRLEPRYPSWKRHLKVYCASLPVVMLCLVVAFYVMLKYFWLQEIADSYYALHEGFVAKCFTFVPSVLYALVIAVMNIGYRSMAKYLNDWENHRLQSTYENHLIVKLVLFDFTNCFMSLFYVAFYIRNMVLLRQHLAALLITSQVLGQVMESVLPYAAYKRRKQEMKEKLEKTWEISEGTLDEYLEMSLQFGYVFLFSAVFPSAAVYALLNNITEIRSDAFKLCHVFQRPFSTPTSSIGAWQTVFEVMSVMAVITNCALIALTPQAQYFISLYGAETVLLVIVIAEHILLFAKQALAGLIPDAPQWVEEALLRHDYLAKKAWRAQVTSSNVDAAV